MQRKGNKAAAKPAQQTTSFTPVVEELEARVLFSGGAEIVFDTSTDNTEQQIVVDDALSPLNPSRDNTVNTASNDEPRLELVFIDAGTPDYQSLLDDLKNDRPGRNFDVVILASDQDGITQINQTLQHYDNVDAVHLVSHGADGEITLGNTVLSADNLASYQSSISNWQQYLDNDADLLIYGCDVAASSEGEQFLQQLALITGADVNASSDATGDAQLGGDWELEFEAGNIETELAFSETAQRQYSAILPNSTPVNNGPFTSWNKNVLPTAEDDGAQDIVAADIDGDGDLDLAAVSDTDDGVIWFENDGNGNFTEHLLSNTESAVHSIKVADLDGDGDMDLVTAAEDNQTVAWWRNDGSENFSRITVSTTVDKATWVLVEDLDEDGDLDLLVSESGPAGNLLWFENDGSENFTEHTVGSSLSSNTSHNIEGIRVADLDGDGDKDLIAAMPIDNGVVWFENDGSENFSVATIDASALGVRDVEVYDIDGDGDMDVIAAIRNNNEVAWYENNGSESFSKHSLTTSASAAQTITLTDINDDGYMDFIATAANAHDVILFKNTGGGNFSQTMIDATLQYPEGSTVGDFDGDGDLDVASASGLGDEFVWYENTTQVVKADETLVFSAANNNLLSVSDSDIGSRQLTLNISVASGSLSLSTTSGLSFTTGDGSNDSGMLVSGSLADINAALDGLVYRPDANSTGSVNFGMSSTDPGTTASGDDGPKTFGNAFFIEVTAGNTVVVTTGADTLDGDTSSITALFNNKGADGHISLREAILATNNTANRAGSPDSIHFNIATADSSYQASGDYWQLTVAGSELPTIDEAVIIDGTTQDDSNQMQISINGSGAGTLANGLTIDASDTVIRGLNMHSFDGAGLLISSGSNQIIERNYLGTDIHGTSAAANRTGLIINGSASHVTVGSDNTADGNVISGNTEAGIFIEDAANNTIKANHIGNDRFGNSDLGNGGHGIHLRNSSDNTIGTTTSVRNIISGNDQAGIAITFNSHNNTVRGNYIGTNVAGSFSVGNASDGVWITDGADNNIIGGNRAAGQGNVLSGNGNDGIEIEDVGTNDNQVLGNYIGLDATGVNNLSNSRHGVVVFDGAANTIIGGASNNEGNYIAAQLVDGIVIDGWSKVETANTQILGNVIGENINGDNRGNAGDGIQIFGFANNTRIGGLNSGEGNIIANSGQSGVQINDTEADHHAIIGNSIYGNGTLDINLGLDGVTANDSNDADTGANDGQNFAVITSAETIGANTQIAGTLNAAPSTNYIIEFFSAPPTDANGNSNAGGARTSLGHISVTTNGSGFIGFSRSLPVIPDGHIITSIVTVDLGGGNFGSSSEFSANVAVTSNEAPVLSNSTLPGNYSEDSAFRPFSGATLTDSDSTDFDGGILTATISTGQSAGDAISLMNINGVSISVSDVIVSGVTIGTISGGSGSPMNIVFNSDATVARINSVIATIALFNTDDNPAEGLHTVTVTITDGDGGTSNAITGSATLSAVNDAPVLDNSGTMSLTTITENWVGNGDSVADIIASAGGDRITDVDSGNEGIAITASSNTGGGRWQYSTDSGTSWADIGSVDVNNALLLRDTDRVRFVPDAIDSETGDITFKAWDQSSGSAGTKVDSASGNAFSSAQEQASILTTAVNDATAIGNGLLQQSYQLNTAQSHNGWVVSDLDNNTTTLTLTLSDTTAGSLSTGTSGAVTSTYNAATGQWSASGAIADINTLLSGLVFTPATGYTSDFTITASAFDGTDTSPAVVRMMQFDAAPTATNLDVDDSGFEDTPLNLTTIIVGDDNGTITVSLALTTPSAGSLNTATSGSVTSSYNAGTGFWQASGDVADVNALLAGLTFTPSTNFTGDVNLAVNVSDGVNPALTGNKTLSIGAINDAPSLDNSGTMTLTTINENQLSNNGNSVAEIILSAGGDRITDSDGAGEGIAITDAQTAGISTGVWQSSVDAGTTWQTISSVSESNALLLRDTDRLRFLPDDDNGETGDITFKAWDQSAGIAGSLSDSTLGTAFSSNTEQASITVNAINDSPTATNLSTNQEFLLDTPLAITPIVVSDVDNSVLTVTLTLSDAAAGALTTATQGSTTSTYNAGTGVWTATGIQSELNALLNNLNFVPSSGYSSDFTIGTNVNDGGLSSVSSKSISFNAAPTATNTAIPESTNEDIPLNIADIVVTDDSSIVFVGIEIADISSGSFNTATVGSTTSTFQPISGTWGVQGSVAEVNAILAGLVFTPTANHHGVVELTIEISDLVNAPIETTKFITINAVNDAPVLDNTGTMTFTSITENDTTNNGNSVAELINSAGGDRITDVDSPNEGIAITDANNTGGGVWQYSIDGGSSWLAIGIVDEPGALLLRDNDRVRFLPDQVQGETGSITFKAWDQSSGVAGNFENSGVGSAFSSVQEVVSINVLDINDQPTISNIPAQETFLLDTPLNLGGFVINDTDHSTLSVSLTLSDPSAGTLNTATAGSVTSGFNAVTGVWTANGNIADLNTLLSSLVFTPASGYSSDVNLSIAVTDGITPSAVVNKLLDFDAAPTASNTGSTENGSEDTPLNLSNIVITEDKNLINVSLTVSDSSAGTLNTATAGSVTSSYNAATGVWTASGNVADVNTLLAGLIFTPTSNYTGSLTLNVAIDDGINAALNDSKTINIAGVNDPPVMDNTGTMTLTTITENDTNNIGNTVAEIIASAGGDRITDTDGPGEGIAITTATSTGSSSGVWQFSDDGGTSWQNISGVSHSNALLLRDTDRVRFLPDGNNGDSGVIDFQAWDQSAGIAGTTANVSVGSAFSGNSQSASISVTAINDAPFAVNIGTAQTFLLNTPLNLDPISVSDVDHLNLSVQLTLSDPAAGALSTGTDGTTTSSYNAATGVWTASGPIGELNTLLANIVFTPASGYSSDFTINTSVSDGSGSVGSVKNMSFNAAPTASNTNTAEASNEDVPLNLADIVINDDDSTVAVTLTLSNPAVGSLNTATIGGTTSSYNALTGVWTANGDIAEVNALLAALTFTPGSNFNGVFTLASSIDDGINPAVTDSKTITINAVNDAPVLDDSPGMMLNPITEDDVNNIGNSVGEIILSTGGDRITDIDSVIEGIAVTSISNQNGHWEYSLNGGSNWQSINNVSNSNALLLSESHRLRFVPDGNNGGTGFIGFRAWDQSSGAVGSYSNINGSNSVSSNNAVATIAVSAINDAPSISGLNTGEHYTEDQAINLSAIHISDVDNSNVTVTLRLSNPAVGQINADTAGAVNATFNPTTGVWQASGNIDDINLLLADLVFTPNAHIDDSFNLTVEISDGNATVNGNKIFTVTAVNDAPFVFNDQANVNEGGSVRINPLANDLDVDDGININSLEIVDGTAHGTLTINADGSISYQHDDSESFNDSFSYRVRDNAGNWSAVAQVQLVINPVNDNQPTAHGEALSMLAGEEYNSTFSLYDNANDADNDTLHIVMLNQPSNGSLEVHADGTFTYTPNSSFIGEDSFTYVISDGQYISEQATVSVRVQTLNENAPNKPQSETKPDSPDDLVEGKDTSEEDDTSVPTPTSKAFDSRKPVVDDDNVLESLRFLKNNPEITALPELNLWNGETQDDRRLNSDIHLGQLQNTSQLDSLESFFADSELWNSLDDRNRSEEEQMQQGEFVTQAVYASSLGVSAGIVSWILRGGSLAAGMLSTLPGWRGVDPLPVLARRDNHEIADDDERARKAEALFDSKKRRKTD